MSQSKDYGSIQLGPFPLEPAYVWSCTCGGHSKRGFGYEEEAHTAAAKHRWRCNLGGFITRVITIQV